MEYDYTQRTANRLYPGNDVARPVYPAPTSTSTQSSLSPFSKTALEFQGKVGNRAFTQMLSLEVDAVGVQRYLAKRTDRTTGAAPGAIQAAPFYWDFVGPEATLYDEAGQFVGQHYMNKDPKGVAWEGRDGSKVVGDKDKETIASPNRGSIPWLILTSHNHYGSGMFASVSRIERVMTVGGVAPPASGISERDVLSGRTADIPYQTKYRFYIDMPKVQSSVPRLQF